MSKASMTNEQRLTALEESVTAWDPKHLVVKGIFDHWRGRPTATSASQISMVEYAKWALSPGQRYDEPIDQLRDQASKLIAYEPINPPESNRLSIYRQPFATSYRLASAIAHTVLAAVAWRSSQIDIAGVHIRNAAKLYDTAWQISKTAVQEPSQVKSTVQSKTFDPGPNAIAILDLLFADDGDAEFEPPTMTTWLVLYDLLLWILGGDLVTNNSNPMKVLTIGREKLDPQHESGYVLPSIVRRVNAPSPGFYPDPLSFGVTSLTASMCQSMRVAWRCCVNELDVTHLSIRVDVAFNTMKVLELSGSSAGGLLAASMYATAIGRKLSPNCSATCRLMLPDVVRHQPETVPLEYHQVWLGKIRGVVAKAREAWLGHDVDEVFVCPEDWKEWNRANNPGPSATEVRTLAELVHGLDRDRPHLDRLDRFARMQHDRWNQILAHQGEPRQDRDHQHRLDLYVPLPLRVEGPPKHADGWEASQHNVGGRECQDIAVPGEPMTDEVLLNLLKLTLGNPTDLNRSAWHDAGDWLTSGLDVLLYDEAGSGKSVCTLRMIHLLSDPARRAALFGSEQAWIVVRFEGQWQRKHSELVSLRDQLVYVVSRQSEIRDPVDAEGLEHAVDFAIRTRRVIVVIDGFDQLKPDERQHVVEQSNADDGQRCRWIIASRQHTIAALFDSDEAVQRWMRVRIEGFNQRHRDAFFAKAGLASLWTQYVDRVSMEEWLQRPVVLDQIRRFIEIGKSKSEPAVFESLSQLALVTARLSLDERALPNSKRGGITPIAGLSRVEELDVLEHVESLIAFQLMLEGEFDGQVIGKLNIERLLASCEERFFSDLDREEAQSRLEGQQRPLRLIKKLESEREDRQQCWDWAIKTLRTIELNNREVLEHNDQNSIAFRSRKAMECSAARYLTKFASPWDVFANDHLPNGAACVWDHITDDQWSETWKLAIEMPQTPLPGPWGNAVALAVIDPLVTCQSLSALFRIPKAKDGKPPRRPTELMWRCWPLLEYDEHRSHDCRFRYQGRIVTGRQLVDQGNATDLTRLAHTLLLGAHTQNQSAIELRKQVVSDFRNTGIEVMKEFEKRFDTVLQFDGTRVPIPADELSRKHVLNQWQTQSSREKSLTMIQCPPRAWIERFEASEGCGHDRRVNDAIDGHETERIQTMRIQATPVTRGMFRLFDAAVEMDGSVATAFWDIDHTDFPVVGVNWYDAWVFCKWIGSEFRLPTGFEWENACRAGTKTEYHFGTGLNGTLANCDGRFSYRMPPGNYFDGCTPVGLAQYPCNSCGIFDCHGNVLEWCDEWDDFSSKRHILRGGCWFYVSSLCRSNSRIADYSSRRFKHNGFRLAAVVEPLIKRDADRNAPALPDCTNDEHDRHLLG